jgi:hypothetical protein
MNFELEHSDKVEPFYNINISLMERNPLLVCRVGFFLMLIINIMLILNLITN